MPKYYFEELKNYPKLSEILKDCEGERFKVNNFEITRDNWRAKLDRIPTGHYVRLIDKSEDVFSGRVVMSDTPMEKYTNSEFVHKAHGKVLIAGLGLGMIILAIQDKPEVEEIVVVEKYDEVRDLVLPQLPLNDKVKVIIADAHDYVPDQQYNTIYLDIWNSIGRSVYEKEMRPMRMRYRKHLVPKSEDPDRFINCWAYEIARDGSDW